MKEKEIIEKVYEWLGVHYAHFLAWRAPSFRTMRWDIFGVFDLIVVTNTGELFFIQCTTTPNLAARRKKINEWRDKNADVTFKVRAFVFAWDKKKGEFVTEEV